MPTKVSASEFARNFGYYRMVAQRESVAVSSHGRVAGYFIAPEEYEAFRRFQADQRSFLTADLNEDEVAAIAESRMDERHAHLNALLEQD